MSEWLLPFFSYMGLGALVGLMAGMLGIGGGFIIVPSLLLLFGMQGVGRDMATQMAVATSLATILATSVSSAHAHHRRGSVSWPLFARSSPSLFLGSLGGAWLASFLPGSAVRMVFALFAMAMSFQMGFGRPPQQARALPGGLMLALGGSLIGLLSGLVGIGGGSLLVVGFSLYGLSMRQAIGTSAACTLPIALGGALGHWLMGLGIAGRPMGTLGYIHIEAAIGIALASVLLAPLGARLAHHLPIPLLKRFFALFLFLLGLQLLWRNLPWG
ncbi:MAG: sulfite exporter TauE/SafE family protein [Cystobacterineae bacterium]|nr:sulfite exporter TauE/SafE family protein [Cystobacterineae bacterium]